MALTTPLTGRGIRQKVWALFLPPALRRLRVGPRATPSRLVIRFGRKLPTF